MITIALMGLLFNLGIARYLDFNRRQSTVSVGLKLKNDLRSIQQKALSGNKPNITPCNIPGNRLDGYLVHVHDIDLREFPICGMSGTTLPLLFDWDPIVKVYPLDSRFRYVTSGVKDVLIKSLGAGVTFHNEHPDGSIILSQTGQTITIRSESTPNLYYSVCVAGGGDIKDCGYASGSPPVCPCP